MRRYFLRGLVIAGVAVVAIAGVGVTIHVVNYFLHPPWVERAKPFDSGTWRSDRECGSERRHMVEDLVANHLRRGMTRERVVQLLGEGEYGDRRSLTWSYAASRALDFFAACGELTVYFDAGGRMIRYEQYVND